MTGVVVVAADMQSRTALSRFGNNYLTVPMVRYFPKRNYRFFCCYSGRCRPRYAAGLTDSLLHKGAEVIWVNLTRDDRLVSWISDVCCGVA